MNLNKVCNTHKIIKSTKWDSYVAQQSIPNTKVTSIGICNNPLSKRGFHILLMKRTLAVEKRSSGAKKERLEESLRGDSYF